MPLPSIEIGNDQYGLAARNELVLHEDHEILPDPPWLTWLKKQSKNDRLFLYRHRHTGRFVVCAWAWSPAESVKPIAVELEGFSDSPTSMWPADLLPPEVMRERLRPAQWQIEKNQRIRKEADEAEARGKREDLAHRNSVVKYMRKQGMERAAMELDTGGTPFVGPARSPEGNERWKETLTELARKS